MSPKRNNPLILVLIAGMAVFVLIPGCGGEKHEYVEVQEVETPDPHAGHNHPPLASAPQVEQSIPTPQNPGFTYTLPEGWTVVEATRMVLLTFKAGSGHSDAVNVSSSAFPGDVGGQIANVNRWRQQIGLEPVDDAAAMALISPAVISGQEAWQVALSSPDGSAKMLVAAVSHDGKTFFFKMVGMTSAVDKQVDKFNAYLSSIQFN
jgi:hypothetical protein